MELYKVHTQILMPFVNETVSALKNMADLEGSPGPGRQQTVAEFPHHGYAVCVVAKTFGEIEGKVLMHHTDDTALEIGNRVRSKMLGENSQSEEINDDVSEALTEFSNTIIGLATRALRDSNLRITFSPPIFIGNAQDMDFIMDGVVEILSIPIKVNGTGEFSFSYLLHRKTK